MCKESHQPAQEQAGIDPNVFFDALSDYTDSPMSVEDGQAFFDKLAGPAHEEAEPEMRKCSKFGHRCNCATDCDPALPHHSQAAQHEAGDERSAEIAKVIFRLVGAGALDWRAGSSGDAEDDAFQSDDDELRALVDLVNEAIAASPVVRAQSEESGITDARRWAECLDLCHGHSDEYGEFVMVQMPRPEGVFKSTEEEFTSAIDAAIRAAQEGENGALG